MEEETTLAKKQIGNYYLIEEIASGSFDTVYRAQHIQTDRIVALKALHVHLPAEKQEHFMQEAQFLEDLQHHHILPLVDVGLDGDKPYFVSEYASGGSLRQRLNQTPLLPWDQALTILNQVGKALNYAHKQQIIHGSLKPENILFNVEGEVVLTDFGIAAVLSTMSSEQLAKLEGDSSYMAPEQFLGNISKKGDQYALGCITYEMATGQRLFSSSGFGPRGPEDQTEPPTLPDQINAQIPMHTKEAILKALSRQRTDRHRDMINFLNALQIPRLMKNQWFHKGYMLSERGEYEESAKAYDRLLGIDPRYIFAYTGKGDALRKLGKYEEALAVYEQAIHVNPDFGHAYVCKGHALTSLNRYEEALEAYEQNLRVHPNNTYAYKDKGDGLYNLKRYEEALEAYERALRINPTHVEAYVGKVKTLIALKRFPSYPQAHSDDADASVSQGNVLGNLNWNENTPDNINWDEKALAAFEQALSIDPTNASSHNGKGQVLSNLGQYEEALSAFEQALAINPNYANAHKNKGNALYNLSRYEEAIEAYEQALSVDPEKVLASHDSSNTLESRYSFLEMMMREMDIREQSLSVDRAFVYNAKGNALIGLNRYEEALRAYEQALAINPNDAVASNNRGNALRGLNRDEEALEAYEQALHFDPNLAVASNNKGIVLCDLNRYEEAVEAFGQALQINPNYLVASTNKANVLSALKRYEEAVEAFDQVLRIDPNNGQAYNNKGTLLFTLNRYEEALSVFDQALHLEPDNTIIHDNKGGALYSLKRYEEALSAFEQALRIDPNNTSASIGKVMALHSLNRFEEAAAVYEQAHQNDADYYNTKGKVLLDHDYYEEALEAFEQALRINPKHVEASGNKDFIKAVRRVNRIGREFGLK